jgi:hypothetical protein
MGSSTIPGDRPRIKPILLERRFSIHYLVPLRCVGMIVGGSAFQKYAAEPLIQGTQAEPGHQCELLGWQD